VEKIETENLAILGAGGCGREVLCLVERLNASSSVPPWNLLGFYDDTPAKQNTVIDGYPVLGTIGDLVSQTENLSVVCSVAKPSIRVSIVSRCRNREGLKWATLIDPSVLIGRSVSIGEGCLICANTIITVDITLGNHVLIDFACTLGHDSRFENFTTLYPGVNIGGYVSIGNSSEIGTGSQILPNVVIGNNCIVGAGAVVLKNLPANCTAVGVPAKLIRS
jgi:sugar O-acyltransferase (sialic acid O-acetyltransferase NeuD family)